LALKKDNPSWIYNYCDFNAWKSKPVTDCGINKIPSNILVDPNGKIEDLNIDVDDLEFKLKNF